MTDKNRLLQEFYERSIYRGIHTKGLIREATKVLAGKSMKYDHGKIHDPKYIAVDPDGSVYAFAVKPCVRSGHAQEDWYPITAGEAPWNALGLYAKMPSATYAFRMTIDDVLSIGIYDLVRSAGWEHRIHEFRYEQALIDLEAGDSWTDLLRRLIGLTTVEREWWKSRRLEEMRLSTA